MNAHTSVGAGKQENPFSLRLNNGQATDVKMGDGPWQPVPVGTWPTSAYPLVLRAGLSRYRAFVEGSGKVEERSFRQENGLLRGKAGLLVEYANGNVTRKVGIKDDRIVYICWGGTAESRLVGSKREAVHGVAI